MKNTIKLFSMMILAAGLLMAQPAAAQTNKQQKQENKEMQKKQDELRKQANEKAGKKASKEEKKLEREGWKTIGLPIDKQLEETYMKQLEMDETGTYRRYICEPAYVTANTYSAAQSMATIAAKLRIASAISTSVAGLAEANLANRQIDAKEAVSITEAAEHAKEIVSQKLGRTFTTLEIYKDLSNGNCQLQLMLCYDMKAAVSIAREVMLEELKKTTEINQEQLEKLLGMDKMLEEVSNDRPSYDEIVK